MRAIIAVLDSLGIGASADAARYGDAGADTFGHIALAAAEGRANVEGVRSGPLRLPTLASLGFLHAAEMSRSSGLPVEKPNKIKGLWGYAEERSLGKDTQSGHWEMAGLPVLYDWGLFPEKENSFPSTLLDALTDAADLPGVLGNCHASGPVILEELGEEHIRSGKPIVYTSVDSVFQIAAHENHFGLDRLYKVCQIARRLVDDYRVGRVIARPFLGERSGEFQRTGNRVDYATPPHGPTLLDVASENGFDVVSIGKVSDIFAGHGISRKVKASGNDAIFDALLHSFRTSGDRTLHFANFVDFDMVYGHRRDVAGYAAALERFDGQLSGLLEEMREGDILVLTADHGCDPTWPGTDHTREHVPVVCFAPGIEPGPVGRRSSFADVGQTIATHLGLPPLAAGVSCLPG